MKVITSTGAAARSQGPDSDDVGIPEAARIARLPKVSLCGWLEIGLVVRSDRGGVPALWIVEEHTGEYAPLTTGQMIGAARVNAAGSEVVFEVDRDGDEVHQLHRVSLPDREVSRLLVEPGVIHELGPLSSDGTKVAYASNATNPGHFDVHIRSLVDGTDSAVWAPGGYAYPAAFSPDGNQIVVGRLGAKSLEADLAVLDLRHTEARSVSSSDREGALMGYAESQPAVQWRPDGQSFLFLANAGREYLGIAEWDADSESWRYVFVRDCDLAFKLDDTGTRLVVAENRSGLTILRVHDALTFASLVEIDLPDEGVASDLTFSPDGRSLAFVFQAPGRSGDVWVADVATGASAQLTHDGVSGLPRVVSAMVTSFDGEPIQVLIYEPPKAPSAPPPAAIVIHGGPEMQARMDFDHYAQALVAAGFLVLRPNVRGSTGFGRRFASLDDGTKRLDALRDVVAVHEWVQATNRGDASRTVLWGVSYGGLLANLALAHEPDRWLAAVVAVAASNIATFLASIAPWRRPIRESEYGRLDQNREFFEHIAAANNTDRIAAPLFLAHGLNDIRVPVNESYQLRDSLAALGREPPLLLFNDDGHHFDRVANRERFAAEAIAFLLRILEANGGD